MDLSIQQKSALDNLKASRPLSDVVRGLKTQDEFGKVLLVLFDGSGSMLESFGTTSKITVAWDCLQNKLLPNLTNVSCGLLLFQGESTVEWIIKPGKLSPHIIALIKDRSRPSAIGSTPMQIALVTAWGWLKQNAKQARIILLTDGLPTDSSSANIIELVSKHTSIPIDTIGIGQNGIGYDPQFLSKISELTGGIFTEAMSPQFLDNIILQLSPEKRYLLGKVT